MNRGIMEQNKLIDTLKRIVGTHSKKMDPIEIIVKKYLEFSFFPLRKVTSTSDLVYFINQKGKPEFTFSPKINTLKVKGIEFKNIQEMFDLDEDALEEIFKDWMKDNFNVDIQYIDYYYS